MEIFAIVVCVVWLTGIPLVAFVVSRQMKETDLVRLAFDLNPVPAGILTSAFVVFWPALPIVHVLLELTGTRKN